MAVTRASLSSPVEILGAAACTAISTLAGTCQRAAGDSDCEGESLSSDLYKFRLGVWMFFDFYGILQYSHNTGKYYIFTYYIFIFF